MKKRILAVCLTLVVAAMALAGCGSSAGETTEVQTEAPETTQENQETEETTTEAAAETAAAGDGTVIRLGGLKGPTSMGMVKLLDDAENGISESQIEFTMAGSADELTPKLLQGELDILAVPANLGAILYNNSDGAVQFAAINTLGVIYIVEKGEQTVSSLADLKGKTLYATGKGSTPEYALNYLLEQNGLDPAADVTIEWKSEPTEVVAQMASEEHAVAMLPQPFVTVAGNQMEDLNVVLDLTAEWDALNNGSQLITAGLVVRKAFAEEHPEALAKFLEEYEASTAYINENIEEGAALVEKYDIVTAAVAQQAIPYCNITYIAGDEMVTTMKGYLQVLYDQNPQSVGGTLPADDFYYLADSAS